MTIIASVIPNPVLRAIDHPTVPGANEQTANEVRKGEKIFLRSREGSYVITARTFSETHWPRLGNDDEVILTLLATGRFGKEA
jgi:hypothetical protein